MQNRGSMHQSDEHAVLVELFRRHPGLAVALVERMPGVTIPSGCRPCAVDAVVELDPLVPDVIIELHDADGKPRLTIIVEAQRSIKKAKRRAWAACVWNEGYRRDCDCHILVVTTSRRVAAWAAAPIHCGASVTMLLVAGPDQIPVITDLDVARANPELAVLSASAHCNDPDGYLVVHAALAVLGDLPPAEARMYSHYIHRTLVTEAVRKFSEDLMQFNDLPEWKFDENGMPLSGYEVILKPMINRALVEERSTTLLRLAQLRGIEVSEDLRERILTCDDAALLMTWIERAWTASSADEVFCV